MAVKVRLRVREFLLTVVAAVIILAGLPSVWKCAQEDRMVQSALSNFNSLFRAEEDNAGLVSADLTFWNQLCNMLCRVFASITSSFLGSMCVCEMQLH